MAVKKKSATKKAPAKSGDRKRVTVKKSSVNRSFRSDSKEANLLVQAARSATANAIRSLNALDLPVTYLEKGVVYRRSADGRIQEVLTLPVQGSYSSRTSIKLKKGMKLHAKK